MTGRQAHRAANHFGLGSSQRDLDAIGEDPVGWVMDQLDQPAVLPDIPQSSEYLTRYQSEQRSRRTVQRSARGVPVNQDDAAAKLQLMQRESRQRTQQSVRHDLGVRLRHAITTDAPVAERLVLFWSNHFTVSQRPPIAAACCAFENEAVRSAINGHFSTMLQNVIQHPVMLVYLDNAQSIGPNSRVGQRRDAGLNENLAREILELHTLGVDGGYTQADVTSLAKIITGWTVGRPEMRRRVDVTPGEFAFVSQMHEPGSHTVLGKRYKADGVEQGVQVLKDIAAHPATADFIAGKLVRHFVADEPSDEDVRKVANVFRQTDGHLPSVHRAVFALKRAWEPPERKLKTPYELLVSTFRGLDVLQRGGQRAPARFADFGINALRTMNHMPFTAPSPAGWPDDASHWGAPSALKQRIEWGVAVGRRLGNEISALDILPSIIHPDDHPRIALSIERAESPAQGLGLLLASPGFQWR